MSESKPTRVANVCAHGVHLYTALGVVFAFMAAAEICRPAPEPRLVFLWLAATLFIDATDGPMARRWNVKMAAPRISGRTIDDIVDYLTFTFLPLLFVWRMGWVPAPAGIWVAIAMVASLFGFANVGAKEEENGFFLGFPSYWNIFAYYAGPFYLAAGPWPAGGLLLFFSLLTILPVRFIYPNLAPQPWRAPVWYGAAAWLILLFLMLPWYPGLPMWLIGLSLLYPAFYAILSVWLDFSSRSARR